MADNNYFSFTALTGGGTGALDAINGALLGGGDMALGVLSTGIGYLYRLTIDIPRTTTRIGQ